LRISIIKINKGSKINLMDYIEKILTNYNINNIKITWTPCINGKLEDRENFGKIIKNWL